MKIAVTGGSGQIGICLVKELLQHGHEVKVLVYDSKKGLEKLDVTLLNGSTLNAADCDSLCRGTDAVFHLAAVVSITGGQGGHVRNVNVNGTRNMLDACLNHRIKKIVHFSSIHAFLAHPCDEPLDESRPLASGKSFPYEKSKAEAQKLVLWYVKEHGLNASIINPTGVLGPEDHIPSVKGKMLLDFYNGLVPLLLPGGFDWVDTRDLVRTAIAALHKGGAGECYLVGGKYYTLLELAAIIEKVTQKKMPKVIAPVWLMKALLPFIYMYGKATRTEPLYTDEAINSLLQGNRNVICKKAMEQLGHSPRPIEETIADSYEWFRKHGYIR
jgi:dihydroflavonol-4-reductase